MTRDEYTVRRLALLEEQEKCLTKKADGWWFIYNTYKGSTDGAKATLDYVNHLRERIAAIQAQSRRLRLGEHVKTTSNTKQRAMSRRM